MRIDSSLLKNTEQCVMCGLCLPHCPTYRISRHEGESPRGRISLIKAYAQGQLSASPAMQTHLQSCTACMNCEQVCPANVSFHSILDAGRELYRPKLDIKTRYLQTLAVFLLSNKWGHRAFKLLQAGAIALSKLGLTARWQLLQLAQLLHKHNPPIQALAKVPTGKSVTIFPGCTADLFDRETLNSTLQLITTLGYQAKLPDKLLCCSALAQHSGLPNIANRQRRQADTYLDAQNAEVIISFASGCGQQLDKNYQHTARRHYDIHAWLLEDERLLNLRLKPLAKKVLLHIPCSMQSNQSNTQAMTTVLKAIPDLTLQTFDDNLFCCGAGGMQLLTPEASNQALSQAKVKTVIELQPDIIVTANIGCALQLRKGIQQADLDIAVVHTVTLLWQQLED